MAGKGKRPVSLTIVGTVWVLMGLLGVVGNITRHHGLQMPDSNFLNILAGFGLLNYWRIARWYALVVAGFTFLFMLPFVPWALMNSTEWVFQFPYTLLRDQRPHEPMSTALLCAILMAYLFFSGWSFWGLSRNDIRELFARKVPTTNFAATH
jgi:hypothetical protein